MDYKPETTADVDGIGKMTKSARIQEFKDIMVRKGDAYEIIEANTERTVCQFCEELDKMGYFDVPASLKFHGTFDGGLFAHSLRVAEILDDYTQALGLKWERCCSPWIVGLFHDLCKCDDYIQKTMIPWVYNPIPEKTDIVPANSRWIHNEQKLLTGHGEKSVMLLSQFITLTEEEILCIRYHMGAYNTDDWNGFDLAIRKYPNVLYTHTADMYASKVREV